MTGKPKRSVQPVPTGYHTVTTYLTVPGVATLLDFLKQAFDAQLIERMDRPDGKVAHAEVKIGDSIVMMGDPGGPWQPRPCNIYLYVEDVDKTYQKAIQAGGKSIREVEDQFYGDRSGGVEDPSGNFWWIATHVEDVPPDELNRRMAALSQKK